MANRTFENFGHFYAPHTMPVLLDCNFTVAATDTAGFGLTGLKGPGIRNVYMHTSATPASGSPNPAAGVIYVRLASNYYRFLGASAQLVSALGTPVTSTTANVSYAITTLGTATVAQWQAVGLPVGLTPAVGQVFTATASASIGGSAAVAPTATTGSNVDHIEVLGDPSATLNPVGPQGGTIITTGGYLIFNAFKASAVTAPADGSMIFMQIYVSNSSVLVKGE